MKIKMLDVPDWDFDSKKCQMMISIENSYGGNNRQLVVVVWSTFIKTQLIDNQQNNKIFLVYFQTMNIPIPLSDNSLF